MAGLYIHIPFCISKCAYCSFYSEGGYSEVPQAYLDALVVDAVQEAPLWQDHQFETVFIGGGTPSLLKPRDLERLLAAVRESFHLAREPEITIEVNPGTIDSSQLSDYADLGVGRISVGVQSMIADELRFLGRSHSPTQALAALAWARRANLTSINADVILGIPGQTLKTLTWTITTLLERIDHISCYLLSIDRGTPLCERVKAGGIDLPSETSICCLYARASDVIAAKGFEHYEVSNWCKPGHRCRHNLNYWRRGEYLGLGAGAHSYWNEKRYMRVRNWKLYVDLLANGKSPVASVENLTRGQAVLEELMLGLRTSSGINLSWLSAVAPGRRLAEVIDDLLGLGLVVKEGENLSLSPKGMLLERAIVERLADELAPSQPLLR